MQTRYVTQALAQRHRGYEIRDMDSITDDDIRRTVSQNAYHHGSDLVRAGGVQAARMVDGGVLLAVVQDGPRAFYQQTISTRPLGPGRVGITGTCTCQARYNCKHVAAALIAWRNRQPGKDYALTGPLRSAPAAPVLPHEVQSWLGALEKAGEDDTEDYPATVRKRLIYVASQDLHSGGLRLEPASIEMLRGGGVSDKVTHYGPQQLQGSNPPRFLRPSDHAILRRLARLGSLDGDEMSDLVRRVIATGRGRWGAVDGPALQEGGAVPGTPAWRVMTDGRQRATLELPPGLLFLRLTAPWYADPATGALGPVETALPPRLLRAILAAPAVPPEAAEALGTELARRMPEAHLPAPRPMPPPRAITDPAQPRLELFAGEMPPEPPGYRPPGRPQLAAPGGSVPMARLLFRYGPLLFPAEPSAYLPPTTVLHGDELLTLQRDRRAESGADLELREHGFQRLGAMGVVPYSHPHRDDLVLPTQDSTERWIDFMLDEVPLLQEAGWDVAVADDFPVRVAQADGPILAEVREGSGIDWFDLDLGVMVDGVRVDLVPALLDLINRGDAEALAADTDRLDDSPVLLRLPDGRMLAIPLSRIQPILAPLLELFAGGQTEGGALRLSRFASADLALLEAAGAIEWAGGDAIRSLGRQLRDAGGIPHQPVPEGFLATLRPYQARGVDWMAFLRTAGLGGVLADDMGLGKTVQALAHLSVEQAAGRLDRPALVVCPTSLVPNWRDEAARFAPGLRVLVLHGKDRAGQFDAIPEHDLVITTYPLLARDHAVLTEQAWHVAVLDEAQTIKNPEATTSKLARSLTARQRLCLSGTPLENHLGELWSLFDFLMPGFLGNRKQFGQRFRTPIEKAGNTERQTMLARRVAPFLLRRTKAEVAADLPPKTDIAETVEMGDAQRAIYEGVRLAMHAKVSAAIASRGLARSGIIVLDALLKLRQACCDPRLLKLGTAKAAKAGSAKLDRLMELLPSMLEDGRRVLLFSQFTSMLALIEAELAEREMPYVLLTGDTRDRATPVRQFQAGKVPLFLISLKAGGTGLNLTAADTVIHYDPWWNPAVEDQATDRAHRIGQDKPVFVHRLVTTGTIEAKMEVLKARKQALVDGILGAGPGATLGVTEAELEDLLGPVG